MEDGGFKTDSVSRNLPGAAMDLDFMDELLYDGCWLTTDGLNISQPGLSSSTVPNDSSQYFPFVDTNLHQQINQDGMENNFPENPPLSNPKVEQLADDESQDHKSVKITTSSVSAGFPNEGSELSRSFWIEPRADPGPTSSVKVRLMHAIRRLKECTKDREVLVQIWVPTKKEGKHVLTTTDQPCFVSLKSESLARYRYVSENYHFPVEGDSKESLGLPGRVFLGKLPESTPDVRFFRNDEYPRKTYAKQYNISGSLAVPVFERGTGTCLGVVEVITTTRYINYRSELETICKALEVSSLSTSSSYVLKKKKHYYWMGSIKLNLMEE